MGWRDQLQPASFRGVAFYVESDDGSFGRRNQVHEYPNRDLPYAEDLGRAAREFSIAAFVVGDDFMPLRDKLIDAIEQPGCGVLIHPFYGTRTVVISGKVRVSHRKENGGYCEFQLSFIEAGELSFPQSKDRTQTQAGMAADALSSASQSDFEDSFSIDGFPQFVSDAALGKVEKALDVAAEAMRYAQPGVAENSITVSSVLSDPALLGPRMVGMFATAEILFQRGEEMANDDDKAKHYSKHANAALDMQSQLPHNTASGDTASRQQMIDNENAVNALMRRQALCNAVGATSLMPVVVHDDVDALRVRLCTAIDNEITNAPDAVLDALLDLRNRTFRDLVDRARDSARLVTVMPILPVPAAVMAYDLYEDALRADEIVARNQIANPAFVFGSVRVLSR